MLHITVSPENERADFTLEDGCPVCEGNLEVRMKAGLSWGYCAACHSLQRKHIELRHNSIEVTLASSARA